MKMGSVWVAVCLVVSLGVAVSAQQPSGADVLWGLGSDARALGMGGAFASLVGDGAASLYNPAGLAFLNERQVGGYAARPFGAFNNWAVSVATPGVALTLLQMGLSPMLETNAFGNPSGRMLNYTSRSGVAGVGFSLMEGLALGAQVKTYFENNGSVSGFGWAVDPGLLYTGGALSLGLVGRNLISGNIVYDNGHEEAWTPQWTVGAAWHLDVQPGASGRLAADVDWVASGPLGIHLGVEVWLENLGLRLGYDRGMVTAGASVLYRNLRLHWAYAFHNTLPDTVRMSASVAF